MRNEVFLASEEGKQLEDTSRTLLASTSLVPVPKDDTIATSRSLFAAMEKHKAKLSKEAKAPRNIKAMRKQVEHNSHLAQLKKKKTSRDSRGFHILCNCQYY